MFSCNFAQRNTNFILGIPGFWTASALRPSIGASRHFLGTQEKSQNFLSFLRNMVRSCESPGIHNRRIAGKKKLHKVTRFCQLKVVFWRPANRFFAFWSGTALCGGFWSWPRKECFLPSWKCLLENSEESRWWSGWRRHQNFHQLPVELCRFRLRFWHHHGSKIEVPLCHCARKQCLFFWIMVQGMWNQPRAFYASLFGGEK